MGDRSILGPADVSDDAFLAMVSASLGVDEAEVLTCGVDVADYDIEALTTAGRYWVHGTASHCGVESAYAFFVKVVQSWTRTPHFQYVPEEMRELAMAGLPWRSEPAVYRSDLADRLPEGLSLPPVHAVIDIDDESAAMWLGAVDVDPTRWSVETFARAAYLLGRLAASPQVRPLTELGKTDVARGYAGSRVKGQVLPALQSEELWRHPLVAETFDSDLRARILAAADALPGMLDELDSMPLGTAHGDACPRNLLATSGVPDDFVLIDFNFWSEAPLGFDLSQLLLGEVQLGERPAAELAELEEACLSAYLRGLHAEGSDASPEKVRRAHALLMWLFGGLSAVPLEVLFGSAPPEHAVRERAQAAAFTLDLVEATEPGRAPAPGARKWAPPSPRGDHPATRG